MRDNRLSVYGFQLLGISLLALLLLALLLPFLGASAAFTAWARAAGSVFVLGGVVVAFDYLPGGRRKKSLILSPLPGSRVAVGMTAYNDEMSIAAAAKDFAAHERVAGVVVVDNNSKDRTSEEAVKGGAVVVRESVQGYGACCMRALREALDMKTEIICLVEGDCTFSGRDLDKMLAYVENADMVLGTRTTRELNTPDSQLSPSLRWGNILMAKLLQVRFRSVRLTDVGCTFRVIRRAALERIIDQLHVKGNHFSCDMMLTALKNNLMVIEIPVTLRKRVGESKGVGSDFFKAAATAFDMWKLIMFR